MTNLASMDTAVQVQGLSKRYRPEKVVFERVSFSIPKGVFVAITGRSGSGKTTLLNILGALDMDFAGEVLVSGRSLHQMSDRALSHFRNRTIGFVFQAFHLIPHFSVLENVLLPWMVSSERIENPTQRAEDLLKDLGLGARTRSLPSTLSAGERQRVAIARALIMDPEVILADEPTGNLDPATGNEVISILRSLKDQGKTVIVVTHDPNLAGLADMRLRVGDGRVEVEE